LDLEDLIAELRAWVCAARRSQDRSSELLDAVVAVSAAAEASKAGAVAADPLSHRTVGGRPVRERLGELRAARQPVLVTAAAASSANPDLRDDLARVLGWLRTAEWSCCRCRRSTVTRDSAGGVGRRRGTPTSTPLQVETMPGLTDDAQLARLTLL
jgi:hypothetical protein